MYNFILNNNPFLVLLVPFGLPVTDLGLGSDP